MGQVIRLFPRLAQRHGAQGDPATALPSFRADETPLRNYDPQAMMRLYWEVFRPTFAANYPEDAA